MYLNYLIVWVFVITSLFADEFDDLESRLSIFDTSYFSTTKSRCYTSRGEPGECVDLKECPTLRKAAKMYSRNFLLQSLSEFTCGSIHRIQVCCTGKTISTAREPTDGVWGPASFSEGSLFETTTKYFEWHQRTESTTKRQKKKSQGYEPPRNAVSSHRNRQLLPEDVCGVQLTDKILGGEQTLIEEFPWMALLRLRLGKRTSFICGGSLISSRYVLTAAHCIKDFKIPSIAYIDVVRLGEYDQSSTKDCRGSDCISSAQDIPVEKTIVHPQYNPRDPAHTNDIALIRLKRAVEFYEYITPVCLPFEEERDGEKKFWTAGWGKTSNQRDSKSLVKQKVEVPLFPLEECADLYKKDLNIDLIESQICAGGEENKDSCAGDSGGPLMRMETFKKVPRWVIRGVVSSGKSTCGLAGTPGIYTRVDKYLNWILDNMQE